MKIDVDVTAQDSNTNIAEEISVFQAALNRVLVQPEIQNPINKSSLGVGCEFNIDEAEVAEFVSRKLPNYLATINTADPEWQELLYRWCRSVAGRHGLNILKHREAEKKHEDLITHLNTMGKRNSRPVFTSDVPTPEEECSQKEEEPIWDARTEDIRARTRPLITADVVSHMWSQGLEPKQIAELLKKSTSTVHGRLKKKQKEVIQEIGIIETKENKKLIKEGLRELFAHTLECPDQDTPNSENAALLNITVSTEQRFVCEPNGGLSKKSDVSVVLQKKPRKKSSGP